mmetsp:Transcript_59385/g.133833  ORF Transcript_59385/g.133833 Transcript_59385/m.133833 type:complete len:366 (+) Transcript_59385:1341-2438(+)
MPKVVEREIAEGKYQLQHLRCKEGDLRIQHTVDTIGYQCHRGQEYVQNGQREHRPELETPGFPPTDQRKGCKPVEGRDHVGQDLQDLHRDLVLLTVKRACSELKTPHKRSTDAHHGYERAVATPTGNAQTKPRYPDDHGTAADAVGQGLGLVHHPEPCGRPVAPDPRLEGRQRVEGLSGLYRFFCVGVPHALGGAREQSDGQRDHQDEELIGPHLGHGVVRQVGQQHQLARRGHRGDQALVGALVGRRHGLMVKLVILAILALLCLQAATALFDDRAVDLLQPADILLPLLCRLPSLCLPGGAAWHEEGSDGQGRLRQLRGEVGRRTVIPLVDARSHGPRQLIPVEHTLGGRVLMQPLALPPPPS